MPRLPAAPGDSDRKQFVGDADVLAALGVGVEGLADPDVRSLVIRHEWRTRFGGRCTTSPYDKERHVAALHALPGSWERERSTRTSTKQQELKDVLAPIDVVVVDREHARRRAAVRGTLVERALREGRVLADT